MMFLVTALMVCTKLNCSSFFNHHACLVSAAGELIESYNRFVTKIESLNISDSVNAKPLLDVSVAPIASSIAY